MARPLRSPGPRALLALASTAVALAAADTYVVVVALPDMMSGVGLGVDALQQATPIVSGFLLGYIAVLPLIGRLADLLPRQRILLACLAVFVVGSMVTATAVELPVLVGGRVLQGIGGGGLVPATLALVADLWPPGRRGTPLGVVGAVQELGSVLGPLLGAAVIALADWRAIFWLNVVAGLLLAAGLWRAGATGRPRVVPLVVGVLATVLGLLTLTAPERLVTGVTTGIPFVPFTGTSRLATPMGAATGVLLLVLAAVTARSWSAVLRRADVPGAVCLAVALGSVVLAFASADPTREVVGPWGRVLLPLAILAVAGYAWRHRTAAVPLIARGVLRGRVPVALLVSVLVGAALVAVVVDVPVLARLGDRSQTGAALVLLRFLVAVPVGALAGGRALRHTGSAVVAAGGLALAAVALVLMSGWVPAALDGIGATAVLLAAGLGLGLAIAPVNAAALADAPVGDAGVASALVVVARMTGMVVGLAVLTAIGLHRFSATVSALPDPTDTAALARAGVVQVQSVLLGGGIAAGAAAVAALWLGIRPERVHDAPEPATAARATS
ncbi:MAG: MFS transporter [Oryzihumus sp.]